MEDFIEKMDVNILRSNVVKRNMAIDALHVALKELKKGRKEINHMAVDPCHVETDSTIREDYSCIIREIGSLIKNMIGGNWCFCVNNTAEREKEIDGEIEKREKSDDMK